ncbi:hypothetical protein F5X99DRAFT_406361 [Biscogniauxia marginata]|nr:hypothetical protein F5X99DRAFT_406361 [Biscogniauxia marginata]
MSFREVDDAGTPVRKIVIKFSLGKISPDEQSDADFDLRNEYWFLMGLRGAEHIGQLIYLADTSIQIPGASDGSTTAEKVKPGQRVSPTFALEYIPNGTAHEMCQPIRQCVAMAFPPFGDWGAPPTREVVIPGQRYFDLMQNSPHLRNVMFGDLQPDDLDHGLVPVAKLIDFGRGTREGSDEELGWTYAPALNIHQAALIVTRIAFPGEDCSLSQPPIQYSYTDPAGNHGVFLTDAPAILVNSKQIDLELRDFLCLCMSNDLKGVPRLLNILTICEWVVRTKTEHMIKANVSWKNETDEVIRRRVQRFIFDADI